METVEIVEGSKVWHKKTGMIGIVSAMLPGVSQVEVTLHTPDGQELSRAQYKLEDLELANLEEVELVSEIVRLKDLKTELNKQVDAAKSAYAAVEDKLAEYLRRRDLQSTRVYNGVGRVSIDGMKVHPSITVDNQEAAFEEIRAMGRGEIIKETIHSKTLESFITELIDNGTAVPAHVGYVLKPKFSITKK